MSTKLKRTEAACPGVFESHKVRLIVLHIMFTEIRKLTTAITPAFRDHAEHFPTHANHIGIEVYPIKGYAFIPL
jgi:ribulose-5-phosphate 4-epimerase/fuculose-1-phosphate aldolase